MLWFDIPLLIALGLGIATITTMCGVGGGLFFVPVLIYFEAMPISAAREISQLAILGTSLVGAITYIRQKRVNFKIGAIMVVFSVAGVLVCKFYFSFLSNLVVTIIFGIFLLCLAVYYCAPIIGQWWKTKTRRIDSAAPRAPAELMDNKLGEMPIFRGKMWVLKTGPLFFAGGFLAALLGVGGGILFVPAFNTILEMPIHFATATSSFTITFTSITNVIVAGFRGQLDFLLGGALIIGAMPGAYLGAHYSQKIPKDVLKCILSAVLGFIGVMMLVGV